MSFESEVVGRPSAGWSRAAVEPLEARRLFTAVLKSEGGGLFDVVASIVDDLWRPIKSQLDKSDDGPEHDSDSAWWEMRDDKAPEADLELSDIRSASESAGAVVVKYEDDRAIDVGTIDGGDLVVTGPDGRRAAVTLIGTESTKLGTEVVATYAVAAPGGSWDVGDNGTWTVELAQGAVKDAWGNDLKPASDDFKVDIAASSPPPSGQTFEPAPTSPPAVVPTPVDSGFSGGTPVTSGFVAEGAVTLEDGRIMLAGRQGNIADGSSQGVLKRLNADGSADRSFGKSGIVVTPAGQNVVFYAVALGADGTLLVTGQRDGDVLVGRYKANGGVDSSFGNAGQTTIDWGATDTAYAIAVAGDGDIVVGGGSNGAFGVSRLTADGDVDTFFGSRGSALFSLGDDNDNTIGAITIQSDGRILGAGSVGGAVAVFRLSDTGLTDRAFGNGGVVVLKSLSTRNAQGAVDHALGLAIQDDRGILVANGDGGNVAVERLLFSGNRDRTFGSSGRTTIDFGGDDDADAIVVQQSGDILVVGTTTSQGGRLAVAALRPDGELNTDYADGGKLTLEAGMSGTGRALHAGSLVLRAFASARGNQVVVGGSDGGGTSTPSGTVNGSGLRRLNVPGSGLLGHFGTVDGRNKNLRFVDGDGTVITLSLAGGSGQAYYDGSNVDLVLSNVADKSRLAIGATGGDGRMKLRNVQANGSLGTVTARTADLAGTFWVDGSVKKLVVGSIASTVATSGSIGTLSVFGDTNRATVLAGADLGSDHLLGGKGTKADTFSAASIGAIIVRGAVKKSMFAAGLDRGNGTFLDRDDSVIGGEESRIGSIRVVKGIDDASRFVAGSLGKANLPLRIDLADDDRFLVL